MTPMLLIWIVFVWLWFHNEHHHAHFPTHFYSNFLLILIGLYCMSYHFLWLTYVLSPYKAFFYFYNSYSMCSFLFMKQFYLILDHVIFLMQFDLEVECRFQSHIKIHLPYYLRYFLCSNLDHNHDNVPTWWTVFPFTYSISKLKNTCFMAHLKILNVEIFFHSFLGLKTNSKDLWLDFKQEFSAQ